MCCRQDFESYIFMFQLDSRSFALHCRSINSSVSLHGPVEWATAVTLETEAFDTEKEMAATCR